MRRRTGVAALLLLVAASTAACTSSGSSTSSPTPSLPGSTTPSLQPTPSPQPIGPAVRLSRGSAMVIVHGDFTAKLTLPIGLQSTLQPPPGAFRITYVNHDGNALLLGGDTPAGHAPTSPDLTLSLVLQGKQAYAFPSASGECAMTARTAPGRIEAHFTCGKLTARGKTITARGTFVAFR